MALASAEGIQAYASMILVWREHKSSFPVTSLGRVMPCVEQRLPMGKCRVPRHGSCISRGNSGLCKHDTGLAGAQEQLFGGLLGPYGALRSSLKALAKTTWYGRFLLHPFCLAADCATMQTTDTQSTADIASGFHDTAPPSALSTPSPCTPPAYVLTIPASTDPTGRQTRSEAWLHFSKAPDYPTSRKVTCKHCSRTFMATGGATTSLNGHLKKKHPNMLISSAGTDSLNG